jgi:hypothetical protein
VERPIAPKLAEFETYLQQSLDVDDVREIVAATEQIAGVGA